MLDAFLPPGQPNLPESWLELAQTAPAALPTIESRLHMEDSPESVGERARLWWRQSRAERWHASVRAEDRYLRSVSAGPTRFPTGHSLLTW